MASTVNTARMLMVVSKSERIAGTRDVRSRQFVRVLDADADEYVWVRGLPTLSRHGHGYLSISDDGTRLIGTSRDDELFVHTLATCVPRSIGRRDIEGYVMGTFSPDGSRAAALAMVLSTGGLHQGDGAARIAIDVIDLDSDVVHTVWTGEGYWSECSVAWSPDGRLLVASYLGYVDVLNTTVVVDVASGRLLATFEDRIPAANPHAVWSGDDAFVAFPEEENAAAVIRVDASTGRTDERLVPRSSAGYLFAHAGRYIRSATYPTDRDVTELYVTDLDGGDPQLFLSLPGRIEIDTIDIPRAWTISGSAYVANSP